MRCRDIIDGIEKAFPPVYAEEWDNVGLLVGHKDQEVNHVFLALDATEDVIEEAIKAGTSMIITHHPMIFKGMKKVNDGDFIGKKVLRLAENKIAYYAMHTNFDVMGMAKALADVLQLEQQEVLQVIAPFGHGQSTEQVEGIGRVGYLPQEMTLLQCAQFVKETLALPFLTVSGDPNTIVHYAAVSSGSGKSIIPYALLKGAEVMITGDIGHHEALDAKEQNLCIIDAGHYGTEKLFIQFMKEWFQREMPEIICSQAAPKEPFWVL